MSDTGHNTQKEARAVDWQDPEPVIGAVFLKDFKNNMTITFFDADRNQVGQFDFSKSPVDFTGDATESAKIFVEFVKSHFGIQ